MSASSPLTRSKRVVSNGSRTKARITLMPVTCSRRILFTASIRDCIRRNPGIRFLMTNPRLTTIAGIATRSSHERCTSSRTAITTPPVIMIGALAIIVQPIKTTICTCWTSLVVRVISDGAPKRPTSRFENDPTFRNTASRRSRPRPIAVRTPK